MSPAKRFGSKLKAIKETLESEGKTPMKTQRMVDRIMSKKKADYEKKKYLTGGQAKIAAKAPPTNKIDAKDFAVLRAEKAGGRGMGLQDEKVKPGKIIKAKRGTGILAEKGTSKNFAGYSKVFEGPRDRGRVSTISGVKPKIKKSRKTFKSMDEMRKAKGFKPGETAKDFNKRRMMLAGAKEAAKATRIGKIVLPIAAAGVTAQQYLKSKMKKKDKKMGGGMMKRPIGYVSGGAPGPIQGKERFKDKKRRPKLGRVAAGQTQTDSQKRKKATYDAYVKNLDTKFDQVRRTKRIDINTGDIYDASRREAQARMKKGGSVTAKCKLGKNKPTKMY